MYRKENILTSIFNFANGLDLEMDVSESSSNRVIAVGERFENYIKKFLSHTSFETDKKLIKDKQNIVFSFGGSKSRIPDLMYRNGPAIEIKKQESYKSDIQLNSSFPKNFLHRNSPKISQKCLEVGEDHWDSRRMYYIIGYVPKRTNELEHLWIVDGECYAANSEIYQSVLDDLSEEVDDLGNYVFKETQEIGKILDIDPLRATKLRIRGMWLISHPSKFFSDYYVRPQECSFGLSAIISERHFQEMQEDGGISEIPDNLKIKAIDVTDPSNAHGIIASRLITLHIK